MYIIQEMQTDQYGITAFLPAVQKQHYDEAESEFYYKCGAAAVSSVPLHAVMTYTEDARAIPELCKAFRHYSNSEVT